MFPALDLKEFEKYSKLFGTMSDCDKFFFVVHSAKSILADYENDTEINLYLVEKIADLTITCGLVEWVIKKNILILLLTPSGHTVYRKQQTFYNPTP